MITKRLKVYVPYLYTRIKYKSIPAYHKNKKGGDACIIVLEEAPHFKYVFKE